MHIVQFKIQVFFVSIHCVAQCAASYSYNLLATLDLGILLRLGHRRGICIVDAFIDVLVSYPEHVYTWEGYSSHSVSSCVCVSVCLQLTLHVRKAHLCAQTIIDCKCGRRL